MLKIDWCTHEAALYAVKHWHYSKSLPTPPLVKIGVWEHGKYIGCVLFGRGASNKLFAPYGLKQTEGCELVRIALDKHTTPVTRIVRIAIAFLKKHSPGLRLIVSFADPSQGHHGGVYQGGGWIYTGQSADSVEYIGPDGRRWHARMVKKDGVGTVYGEKRRVMKKEECVAVRCPGKYRYLMPLDEAMREQVKKLSQPYPKSSACAGVASLKVPPSEDVRPDPHAPSSPKQSDDGS